MGPSRSSSPQVVFRFRNNDHHMAIVSAEPPLNHLGETHTKEGEKTGRASARRLELTGNLGQDGTVKRDRCLIPEECHDEQRRDVERYPL